MSTPREDGLRMPAEWEPHAATFMEWPMRADLWGDRYGQACRDYAEVANAIAAFESVVMVTDPSQVGAARALLSGAVEILPIPIDDSWMRDNGPIFVVDGSGGVALVHSASTPGVRSSSRTTRTPTCRVTSRRTLGCAATRRRWSSRGVPSSWTGRERS
jgi:hypothetical protein